MTAATAALVRDRFDVIVCGSGLSGLSAALTAAQSGARVLLAEKGPRLGGTTLLSSGNVWTRRDFDELRSAVPDGNPVLQQLVFDSIDVSRAWLAEQGVALEAENTNPEGLGRGHRITTAKAIPTLAARLEASGGTIQTDTALDELLVGGSCVVGMRAAHRGSTVEVRAAAVVLATGGFQGNPELLQRYVVPTPDNLYLRANPWSTGDAFLAATKIGAAVTPALDTFYGHAMIAPPAHFDQNHFSEVCQYYGANSVALNQHGVRFADESDSTGEEVLNQRLARQPGGRGFYVTDAAIAATAYTGERLNKVIIDRAKRLGAPMVVADTLEELAQGLAAHGLPPATVLRTIQEFNLAILTSTTENLTPPRRRKQFALTHPPYYAVGVKASITLTTGGLAVDERMRVLRRAGTSSPIAQSITSLDEYRTTPIPGLYAAGGDVGNINHLGYLGCLGAGLVTGRVAGSDAAHHARTAA